MIPLDRGTWTARAIALGWDARLLGDTYPTGRNDCLKPLGLLLQGEHAPKVVAVTAASIELIVPAFVLRGGRTVTIEGPRQRYYNPNVLQPWCRRVVA